MDFFDFKDDYSKLLGKVVLVTWRTGKRVDIITKVNKTSFKIKSMSDNFSVYSGGIKGHQGFDITKCELLTPEQEQIERQKIREHNEKYMIKKLIQENIDELSLEQLRAIKEIIVPKEITVSNEIDK